VIFTKKENSLINDSHYSVSKSNKYKKEILRWFFIYFLLVVGDCLVTKPSARTTNNGSFGFVIYHSSFIGIHMPTLLFLHCMSPSG
jgi:hypothetical protein